MHESTHPLTVRPTRASIGYQILFRSSSQLLYADGGLLDG